MIALTLVRHAKSDWGEPTLGDHERPLNARGLRDAPMLAARQVERGLSADRLLSSTAVRARTTAGFFATALGLTVELDRRLYGAHPEAILEVAQGCGAERVIVVAHNPGLSVLAYELSGGGISSMPTCAVARFEWDADAAGAAPTSWRFDAPATVV